MPLSDGVQAAFVAIGSASLAVEGYLATSGIDPQTKTALMTLFGAIAVGAFAIKEALGAKPPATTTN